MILIAGGTGFIGQALSAQLVQLGIPVRLLLNPSVKNPKLPKGIPIEVGIAGLNDERGLKAAMKDVTVVFNLIGTDAHGIDADYLHIDIPAAEMLSKIATEMKVKRFIHLSHIGAEKSSAYRLLRAKGIAEAAVIQSGVPYTIVRSGLVYGEKDHFTNTWYDYLRNFPYLTILPGGDEIRFQPIWIEDLLSCLLIILEDETKIGEVLSVAGIETMTIQDIIAMIMTETNLQKHVISIPPYLFRVAAIGFEQWLRNFPHIYFWVDYLTEDRITQLDVLPRNYGLMPTRLSRNIAYLKNRTH